MGIRNRQSEIRNGRPGGRGVARVALVPAAAAILLAAGGCIPSYPLAEGELDRYWTLTDVAADAATQPAPPPKRPRGMQLPTRWVIRQRKGLIWSTISIVRAMDKLKAGTSEIEFSVSPKHTSAVVDILAEARQAMTDLREMLETSGRGEKDRWADALAAALVRVEGISRLVVAEEGEPPADEEAEPMGMAAEPLLDMLAMYLDERSDGSLLGDLSPGEMKRLRDVLAEMVVRLGFEVAGKEPPAGLRRRVAEQMRRAGRPDELRPALTKLLAQQIRTAPPARAGTGKRKTVQSVLRYGRRAVKFLEVFLSQWDRMDRITVETIRRGEEGGLAVTIAVQPGKEVRIDQVMTGLPVVVFRGRTRMTVLPSAGAAGETVVAFDPVGDGAVELRYEGLIYGLVKLFALPLASGPIREVRVSSARPAEGRQLLNVAVLSEATGDRKDPRRMIVVQDARTMRILRRAFAVESVAGKRETVVSYITPARRYTYQRIKGAPDD